MTGGCLSKLRGRLTSSLTALASRGGSVDWVIGTGPRRGSTNGAGGSARTVSVARPSARTMVRMLMRSHLDDLHRALLEVGLERDRVGRIQRHLVDQLAGIEPGHEDEAARAQQA